MHTWKVWRVVVGRDVGVFKVAVVDVEKVKNVVLLCIV